MKFPATDPLNSLLSFFYSLLTQEMGSLIESEGLDPCLGFLHAIDRSRPSLALDLIEPFRHPVVDRLVLTLANRAEIAEEDFALAEQGHSRMLTPAALKRALGSYEKWMLAAGVGLPSFRALLRSEVRKLLKGLRKQQPFIPFKYPEDLKEPCDTSSVTT